MGWLGCYVRISFTYRTVDKAETSDYFSSLQEDEEGATVLEHIDLHDLYTMYSRVIVVVLELKSVIIVLLSECR